MEGRARTMRHITARDQARRGLSDSEVLVFGDVVQSKCPAATMELYATPRTHQKSMATAHSVLKESRIYGHGRVLSKYRTCSEVIVNVAEPNRTVLYGTSTTSRHRVEDCEN